MIAVFVAVVVALVVGFLFLVSLALRQHGESPSVGSGWRRTDEIFRDPSSDRLMRVWEDGSDGSRHYVPEP